MSRGNTAPNKELTMKCKYDFIVPTPILFQINGRLLKISLIIYDDFEYLNLVKFIPTAKNNKVHFLIKFKNVLLQYVLYFTLLYFTVTAVEFMYASMSKSHEYIRAYVC